MSRIVSVTQKAAAGAKRIFDILDHVSNVPEPAQPVKIDPPRPAPSSRCGRGLPLRQPRGDPRARPRHPPGEMIGLVATAARARARWST